MLILVLSNNHQNIIFELITSEQLVITVNSDLWMCGGWKLMVDLKLQ